LGSPAEKVPFSWGDVWNLKLDTLPIAIADALKVLDLNDDGKVEVDELAETVLVFSDAKKQNKLLKRGLKAVTAFMLLMLIGNVFLVFAVMQITKDISAHKSTGRLTLPGTDILVRTGDSERTVNKSYGSPMVNNAGHIISTTRKAYTRSELSSFLPDQAYDELKVVRIAGDNGAHMNLALRGWSRNLQSTLDGERTIPVITLITLPGNILVRGTALYFEDFVGEVFVEAGFAVNASSTSGSRRKLLQVIPTSLIGGYNHLEWSERFTSPTQSPTASPTTSPTKAPTDYLRNARPRLRLSSGSPGFPLERALTTKTGTEDRDCNLCRVVLWVRQPASRVKRQSGGVFGR